MHGIIVIDKPAGPTSAEVVRQIKGRLGKHTRVGHLGTLDPFATGVLPILVGEGTKLAPFLQEGEKEYTGVIALGTETATLDRTGAVVRTAEVPLLDAVKLCRIAAGFVGEIEQTPPIFSAIKRQGVPLYRLARRGIAVEPPSPRRVTIAQLELVPAGSDRIQFTVACSSGMYVRALARDIGVALESAAHLESLCRTRSGNFSLKQARRLSEVLAMLETGSYAGLINLRDALPGLQEVHADADIVRRLHHGDARALDCLVPPAARRFKVVAGGDLVAIAEASSRVTATLLRVFGVE